MKRDNRQGIDRLAVESEQLKSRLAGLLENRKEIILAYLFGSRARESATPLSDIDLAVMVDDSVSPGEYARYRASLLSELMPILGTDRVDLVLLNEGTPLLNYQVVRDGRLLLERRAGVRADFAYRAISRYLDTIPLRKVQDEYLRQRIKRGALGKRVSYRRTGDRDR